MLTYAEPHHIDDDDAAVKLTDRVNGDWALTATCPEGDDIVITFTKAEVIAFARAMLEEVGRDDLVQPGVAAAALGVAPKTVSRWLDDGTLTGARTHGGHRRVTATSLAAALAEKASR